MLAGSLPTDQATRFAPDTNVKDTKACAAKCLSENACRFFTYRPSNKICSRYDSSTCDLIHPTEDHATYRREIAPMTGFEYMGLGYCTSPAYNSSRPVDYKKDCAALCNSEEQCKFFAYRAKSKRCNRYDSDTCALPVPEPDKAADDSGFATYRREITFPMDGFEYMSPAYCTSPAYNSSRHVNYKKDCAALCNSEEHCKFFAYRAKSKRCNRYDSDTCAFQNARWWLSARRTWELDPGLSSSSSALTSVPVRAAAFSNMAADAPWDDVEALIVASCQWATDAALWWNILKTFNVNTVNVVQWSSPGKLETDQGIIAMKSLILSGETRHKLLICGGSIQENVREKFSQKFDGLTPLAGNGCASIWSDHAELQKAFVRRWGELDYQCGDDHNMKVLMAKYPTLSAPAMALPCPSADWTRVQAWVVSNGARYHESTLQVLEELGVGNRALFESGEDAVAKLRFCHSQESGLPYHLFIFLGFSAEELHQDLSAEWRQQMPQGLEQRAQREGRMSMWSADDSTEVGTLLDTLLHDFCSREARATHEAFVSQCDLQAPPVSTGQAGGPEALILGSGDPKSEAQSGDEDEDEGDTSPTGGCSECFESVWCYETFFRRSLGDGHVTTCCNSQGLPRKLLEEVIFTAMQRLCQSTCSSLTLVFAGTATCSGAWCLNPVDGFFDLRQLLALWKRALGGQSRTSNRLCIVVDTCFAASFFNGGTRLPPNFLVQCACHQTTIEGCSFSRFYTLSQSSCAGLRGADLRKFEEQVQFHPCFYNPGGDGHIVELMGDELILDDDDSVSTADTQGPHPPGEHKPGESYLQDLARQLDQRDKPTLSHFVMGLLHRGRAQQMISKEIVQSPKLEMYLETLYNLMRPVSTRGSPAENDDVNEIIAEVCQWWQDNSRLKIDDALSHFLVEFG
eukprot:s332_g13.t1